jgi:predicted CopG family antitoxin
MIEINMEGSNTIEIEQEAWEKIVRVISNARGLCKCQALIQSSIEFETSDVMAGLLKARRGWFELLGHAMNDLSKSTFQKTPADGAEKAER